jgi:hypothetical protein
VLELEDGKPGEDQAVLLETKISIIPVRRVGWLFVRLFVRLLTPVNWTMETIKAPSISCGMVQFVTGKTADLTREPSTNMQ